MLTSGSAQALIVYTLIYLLILIAEAKKHLFEKKLQYILPIAVTVFLGMFAIHRNRKAD
jgi:hypothetical protein